MLGRQLFGPQAAGTKPRPQATAPAAPHPLLTDDDRQLLADLDDRHADFLYAAEHADGHSPFTIALYKQTWSNFQRFLKARSAASVTAVAAKLPLLEQWAAWNHARSIAPITVNSYWRMLRPFFNFLERTEGFTNPYAGAKPPGFERPDPKALKPEQLRRVLAAARNYPWRTPFLRARALALIGVMAFAGLRRSEALHMEFDHVSIEDGTIQVPKGKGRHGGKPRTAYMLPDLLPLMRTYIAARKSAGYTPPEFFATGPGTGVSLTQFRRIIRIIRDASGVPLTPHSLRHTYITLLVRNRTPLHAVQAFAGHADLATTQRYMRVFDEDLQRYARRVRLQ